ncbi:MAG: hypothetical protein IJS15_05665 [Victivallales bacterium]|nr:hypothetical protein [Victivallales bacterium]
MALDPYSVRLRLPDGTEMRRGIDFDYTEAWGTVGRLAGGRISETQSVLISYRYIPNRLDSVIIGTDGKLRIANGVPRSYCPKLPALKDGEKRLLNIFTDAQTDKLNAENIFIIMETEFPAESARAQQTFIPNVMKKLRNGEHVKVLAWGDSVTESVTTFRQTTDGRHSSSTASRPHSRTLTLNSSPTDGAATPFPRSSMNPKARYTTTRRRSLASRRIWLSPNS